jgi:hypothetical protein
VIGNSDAKSRTVGQLPRLSPPARPAPWRARCRRRARRPTAIGLHLPVGERGFALGLGAKDPLSARGAPPADAAARLLLPVR